MRQGCTYIACVAYFALIPRRNEQVESTLPRLERVIPLLLFCNKSSISWFLISKDILGLLPKYNTYHMSRKAQCA